MPRPRFIAIAAMTLDGKIAVNHHHASTWTSAEDKRNFRKLLDECDAVIVGMHTYRLAQQPLAKRHCIVLTRSVRGVINKSATVTYCNPQTMPIPRFMKKCGYKRVAILGGTQTYSYCFKKELIDELYLTIEPIVFGRGLPFVDEARITSAFRIVSMKKLNAQGTILLHAKRM